MIRGKTLFRCSQCGKWFTAVDVEQQATSQSVPTPCPRCGSKCTAIKDMHLFARKSSR
ncbi:MAG: zinc ribbon domain-containing protein [Bacteroidales bacterium]|nr:zinc ribbon domain-containing protein [Bacteroidales bacterium]